MSTVESTKTLAGRPWPNGDPATWVYLKELPTPPEVTRAVEEERRRYGWWWGWWYRSAINGQIHDLKLCHYFPGQEVVFKFTQRGWLILLVAAPFAPEIETFLASLTREERCQVGVDFVSDSSDDTTRLPSSFLVYEDDA